MFDKRLLKNVDWVFILFLFLILGASLLVLSTAGQNIVQDQPLYYFKKQATWIALGLIVMTLVSWIDYNNYDKFSKVIYVIMILALAGLFLVPADDGVHRWYNLGFIDFQASELGKLGAIICLSSYLANRQDKLNSWSTFFMCFLIVGFPMALVFLEPDLGSSLVFGVLLLAIMWIGGIPTKRMLGILLLIGGLVLFVMGDLFVATHGFTEKPTSLPIPLPLQAYQLLRLVIFINPDMDPLDTGYHIIQSQVAIGSGGLFGKGYGEGSQVQGNFLPEHHTDFINSAAGEEFGFVGEVALLAIYFMFLIRILMIAKNAPDMFGKLLVVGIGTMFSFQIFVNIGMTIGMMPVTGITLPFMSYGGTSMLINLIGVGVILSVNMRSRNLIF